MVAEWSLRETTPEDEDFLWDMLFYASHSNDEPGVHKDDVRENPDLRGYIDGWRRAGRPGVVAHRHTRPLGAAWLRVLTEADETNAVYVDERTPELAVAVLPGEGGKGIGTAMIRRLIDVSVGRFPAIVLSSRVDNPAVNLYRRLGFEVVDEITNRVGTRSVKMILPLRPRS